jgi:tetratricopeptide (TPR) repeat protein
MAQRGDEHRMVFDIRGRRRHVVKFAYAILAILMALSLFLVTGIGNIGSLFGSNSSSGSPAAAYEEQAERIETKLKKEPESEDLLLSLSRARATAGNTLISTGAAEGSDGVAEIRSQLNQASDAWSKYLKSTKEPSPGGAQIMAPALFTLAQASTSSKEAEENIEAAAEAEEIVAKARPSLNSWSTLAEYEVFTGDYKAAKEATEKATKYANTKFERESLENKLTELEKSAREFQKGLKEEEKAKTEAAKVEAAGGNGAAGANPLNGIGGSSLTE